MVAIILALVALIVSLHRLVAVIEDGCDYGWRFYASALVPAAHHPLVVSEEVVVFDDLPPEVQEQMRR